MENGGEVESLIKADEETPVNSSEPVVMVSVEKSSLNGSVVEKQIEIGKASEETITCTVELERKPLLSPAETPSAVAQTEPVEENGESRESPKDETTTATQVEADEKADDEDESPQVTTAKVEQQDDTSNDKPLSPLAVRTDADASALEEMKEASVEVSDENDKKDSTDMEVEDQQSSTSSSPSALHIHLDEEDKDETLNDVVDKEKDPSMPLISNVVSLSSVASSSSSVTPPPPTRSEESPSTQPPSPTPSAESGNGNVRRTTLRFKRGIEISFEVDQNGQPVTLNNHEVSSTPSASSGEPRQKRGRLEDDDDEDYNQPDLSELDAEGTQTVLLAVQKDIRTLRFMAKQKEKEWNYILKLMKSKEELLAKLLRRKDILKITANTSARKNNVPSTPQVHTVAQTQIQQPGAASLQTLINQSLNAMMAKSNNTSKNIVPNNPFLNHQQQPHVIQKQLQQQIQQQQQQLQQQAKMNRQRPILPKPTTQVHPDMQSWNQQNQQQHHHHHNHHHQNNSSNNGNSSSSNSNNNNHNSNHHLQVVDSVLGACADSQADARNRQGTISVQSLIADYRAKHPEEIPTRGRRIRQPSRICNDPNSSSSPPPNAQSIGSEGPSMSFKDVLLQFAKMSSRQGHPNPVEMIQVGKESPGTSGSNVLAGSSGSSNSSAAALQSLAAARNARSSPHTAALSAGSILQNALSGSRANPSFAPTLAQLLTNPANEQQQQQAPQQPQQQQSPQQQHPHSTALSATQPTVSVPIPTAASSSAAVAAVAAAAAGASSSEVLTLSNLLATARGHVTITPERGEHANDDVTVVGGSTSGRNVSSNNGNYMRTSGGGEVPKCQGCNERVAQFVCAGCSSQWYCSRECQVAAWEEHSENCVG